MSPIVIHLRKLNTGEKKSLTMCTENRAKKSELLQLLPDSWDCWLLNTPFDHFGSQCSKRVHIMQLSLFTMETKTQVNILRMISTWPTTN